MFKRVKYDTFHLVDNYSTKIKFYVEKVSPLPKVNSHFKF